MGIVKRADLAEDARQECFILLLGDQQHYKEVKFPGRYFQQCCINKAYDLLEEEAKNSTENIELIVNKVDMDSYERGSPFKHRLMDVMEMGIERLPMRRRMIMGIKRSQGITNAQIADKLGIAKLTVDKTIQNAIRDIREYAQQHMNPDM
ncbi:RNA polymerase ECF-type sigma factor [Filimonas lacunae]|nr:RNA polymerase ECF-type sigma factor [Filimonas lacunae]